MQCWQTAMPFRVFTPHFFRSSFTSCLEPPNTCQWVGMVDYVPKIVLGHQSLQ
jgi:hypothetical protein